MCIFDLESSRLAGEKEDCVPQQMAQKKTHDKTLHLFLLLSVLPKLGRACFDGCFWKEICVSRSSGGIAFELPLGRVDFDELRNVRDFTGLSSTT